MTSDQDPTMSVAEMEEALRARGITHLNLALDGALESERVTVIALVNGGLTLYEQSAADLYRTLGLILSKVPVVQ